MYVVEPVGEDVSASIEALPTDLVPVDHGVTTTAGRHARLTRASGRVSRHARALSTDADELAQRLFGRQDLP